MRDLARRERERVVRLSRAGGFGEYGLERLLALALMNEAGLSQDALTALGELDVAPGLAGQALLDALAQTPWWIAPPEDGPRRLARLEPDRPAAAFLDLALLSDPSPRLPDWLFAASSESGAQFGRILSRLCFDLAELSEDRGRARLLEAQALKMLEAEPGRAAAFAAVGHEEGTHFSAGFAVRVLEHLLSRDPDPERRAGLQHNLAVMLSALGRREDALAAAQEATDLYRRLSAERPDTFNLDLSMSLNNLASTLADLGRRKDALDAAEEAADLCRRLADQRSDVFTPDLAASLNNQAKMLAEFGHHEDALDTAKEAVGLYRRLDDERPDAFSPDLAMSLYNMAIMLSVLGRQEDALDAAAEAADLRRRLAAERPDAFTPEFARSLSSLAIMLTDLGRYDEALVAAEEGADLRRRLATEHPDIYTPDFAGSHKTLAIILSDLGRREEALAAAEEAVSLLSPYFLAHQMAFAGRMQAILRVYLQQCETLVREPDTRLLTPIVKGFKALETGEAERRLRCPFLWEK